MTWGPPGRLWGPWGGGGAGPAIGGREPYRKENRWMRDAPRAEGT